jgi:protein-tyrosine phosphatase
LDIESANIARLFNDTYNVISDGLSQGGVLVHCAAGVSRSSSTVIAYLMRKQKMSFNDAFMFVKKRRSVICPNYGFQR